MRFLFVPLLFVCCSASAQDSLLFKTLVPRQSLKFSPNHLLAFYPTLQFGYELRVADRFSIQLEGGYVLNYPSNGRTQYQNKRGVKTKFELRYYMLPSARAKLAYYGALEFYWNAVNFDRLNSQQECYDLECNHMYTRSFTYMVKYRESGVAMKFGFVKYFSRFFMDVNSGWSLRFIDYTDPFPNFNDAFFFFNFLPDEESRVTAGFVVGARVGYRINKQKTKN